MFSLSSYQTYYLYAKPCDMRKSFDGLCGIVRNELKRKPIDGSVYVFLNRRATHLKLLQWEAGGFVLYYKRLEQGTFRLPLKTTDTAAPGRGVSYAELVLMVQGIQVSQLVKRKRYVGPQKTG
jgi:transposase